MINWDENLDHMLFMWTAGQRIDTLPLIDTLHFIRTGTHLPEIERNYPEFLASPGLIETVEKRIKEVQETLRKKYPSGFIKMYRGGKEGSSWTTSRKQAEFFASKKGTEALEKDVPIEKIALNLEPYTREPEEEEYILL